ncbi:MAG: right-handed parallel beta-helix repeat-containing protein [Candidatus Thermoplasmatota archaeon]|nr:right-handed parallel beta-helix repeat-containing protein [Candidatus Thermoplasmatota archaeon]MBU4255686.1 right-handed parallel beta-helix repeat-containing protein [Candidatus Thermoplasmatota archaeon]MCG2826659.1 right-handed parallel beta-helix repeat-containing protein [Thermoplasmatales archaeon]
MSKRSLTITIIIILCVTGLGFLSQNIIADESNTKSNTGITIWDTDQTLASDYIIYENEILMVEPGVTVYLDEDVSIFVFGTLQAEGIEEESVTFTHKDESEYWGFIRFEDSSADVNCTIKYTRVEYATQGIYCDRSSPTIANSKIMSNSNVGIYLHNSQATIAGNTISQNKNMGIQCDTSSPVIYNNTISDTDNFGIYCYLSQPTISRNVISSNGNVGIYADSSPLEVHENNIYDNVAYGVYNGNPSMMVNATDNYWGSSSGPSGVGPGSGDKISEGVVYNPWLEDQLNLRPPSCSILYPQKDAALKGVVNITGNSSDVDSDVVRVEVKIDSGVWQEATGTLDWTYLFDSTTVVDGYHIIYVRADDGIHCSDIISLKVRIDNPPIVIINEESQTVNTSSFLMSWSTNATDIQYYEIRIGGNEWINVGTNTSYTFILSEGKNTLYVRGVDNGGNIGVEDSIVVTYEKQGKAVTSSSTSGILILLVIILVIIFISIILLRHKRRI